MRDCPVCNVAFLPTHGLQKYCSIPCRHRRGYDLMVVRFGPTPTNKTKYLRTAECKWCGHRFSRATVTRKNMNSCSAACSLALQAFGDGSSPLVRKIYALPCGWCKSLFVTRSASVDTCSLDCKRARSAERKAEQTEREADRAGRRNRPCRECGISLGVFSLVTYCDECRDRRAIKTRREGSRSSKHRRRALMHGAEYERINTSRIYERDAWRCGVCGKRVDKALTYPHRMSASLDHIVPLAHGGTHTKANVQLAHLICNWQKSDKLDVQPLLFG